jgi:hypothetical protein
MLETTTTTSKNVLCPRSLLSSVGWTSLTLVYPQSLLPSVGHLQGYYYAHVKERSLPTFTIVSCRPWCRYYYTHVNVRSLTTFTAVICRPSWILLRFLINIKHLHICGPMYISSTILLKSASKSIFNMQFQNQTISLNHQIHCWIAISNIKHLHICAPIYISHQQFSWNQRPRVLLLCISRTRISLKHLTSSNSSRTLFDPATVWEQEWKNSDFKHGSSLLKHSPIQ